jgi:hypothetical protein
LCGTPCRMAIVKSVVIHANDRRAYKGCGCLVTEVRCTFSVSRTTTSAPPAAGPCPMPRLGDCKRAPPRTVHARARIDLRRAAVSGCPSDACSSRRCTRLRRQRHRQRGHKHHGSCLRRQWPRHALIAHRLPTSSMSARGSTVATASISAQRTARYHTHMSPPHRTGPTS